MVNKQMKKEQFLSFVGSRIWVSIQDKVYRGRVLQAYDDGFSLDVNMKHDVYFEYEDVVAVGMIA